MAIGDSGKRMAILRTLYDRNIETPGAPTANQDLEKATQSSSTEATRCIRYLHEKRYVKVQYFIGGGFIATITALGIDTVEMSSPEANGSIQEPVAVRPKEDYVYDVAISYAGENKDFALEIHAALKQRGVTCYLALLKKSRLWGQKLDDIFETVFSRQARFVIVLVSKEYRSKRWTDFELSVALKEAKERHGEYILPVRLDDTLFQGIPSTVAYLSYAEEKADGIADALAEKLSEDRLSEGNPDSSQRAVNGLPETNQSAKLQTLAPPQERRAPDSVRNDDVCYEGPFEVESGGHVLVPLNLHKGDSVEGSIDEIEGDAFDWYIISEKNMVKFKRKEEFNYERGDEGEGAYHLRKWNTPREGPWYLLLSAHGKQYPREITVRLRKASA